MQSKLELSSQLLTSRTNRRRIILFAALLVSTFVTIAHGQKPQAVLPKVYIDTTWNLPVGGTTWAAHTAAQFSSALKSSSPGDIIVLDAGATYSGNFHIPVKANPNQKWIYVVSSAYGNLPAPGTRATPADAVNMPKIVTPGAPGALGFVDGSNHWRFVGIEVASASTYSPPGYTPGVYYGYALIGDFGNPPVTLPDSIVFDRCYVHGDATHDVQEGLQGNASNFAVVDSYISEIHMKGTDTQAVAAFYTPGPIKLVNNHLEAAGENVMFGGAGGHANPYVPSDIEVRNNYLYKPLSWAKVGVGIPPNNTMVVKDALEFKSAQRILFDSNIIANVWASGQSGFAVLLTVRTSQSGDIAVVNDITLTNNILENVVSGFMSEAIDDQCASSSYPNCHNAGSQARWYIANNQIVLYDPTLPGGARNELLGFTPGKNRVNGLNAPGVMHDVVFQHNTVVPAASAQCWNSVYFSIPSGAQKPFSNLTNNIWILDNALCREPTGDWGLQGTSGLTQYIGNPSTPPYDLTQRFYGNVMYVPSGNKVQVFPPANYATTVPFTYVDPSTGDFQLLTPYWTNTSDGQLSGVNFANLPTSTGP
jgi:hypothetical protein